MQIHLFLNRRGSAIIMALATMTLLLILGMAVITLSTSAFNTNMADATVNEAYYAAEAGVNSGIEQVKLEVAEYYKLMSEERGSNYTTLYNNFFPKIATNARDNFVEPSIKGMSIDTTFSLGHIDSSANTGDILISCKACANGTKYIVNGSVNVERQDLSGGDWLIPNVVLYAGGTLTLNQYNDGVNASGAPIIVGGTSRIWANPNCTIKDDAADAVDACLTYAPPNLANKVISLHITAANNVISSYPSGSPIYVTSDPGITVTLQANPIPEGIIYIKGDLILNNHGDVNADIYCDGNVKNNSGTIRGNVYCKGSFSMTNGQIWGSVFADGPITISGGGGNSGVIYSSSKLTLGNFSAGGLFFSGGDVIIDGGPTINGMVIAKGNVYPAVSWSQLTVTYSQSYIDSIVNNPNYSFFFGGNSSGSGEMPDSSVITAQHVKAAGLTN